MLGIAIINYNTFEKTIECIDSLFQSVKSEYRIYLIDNASQNNSFDELKARYENDSRVVLIKSEENLGYARGNNVCLERAQADGCDAVLISNNDMIYYENTVDTLLQVLRDTGALIAAPKIIGTDKRQQNSVKAHRPSFKEYLFHTNYVFGKLVSEKKRIAYARANIPREQSEAFWVSGACFMADMAQFDAIGFFDPYTFLYFEEFIISEKAAANGMKILFVPQVTALHYHGASTGGSANLFTRLENFRSECYVLSNYWILSKARLRLVRFGRCLEVLYTFTKERKYREALTFIKESRKILRTTPRKTL